LFLDVLRERGNTYLEHSTKDVPHVLNFRVELVRDGRSLRNDLSYKLHLTYYMTLVISCADIGGQSQ
jgi:hypothetical protein